MTNHFSILALRTPRTVGKGKKDTTLKDEPLHYRTVQFCTPTKRKIKPKGRQEVKGESHKRCANSSSSDGLSEEQWPLGRGKRDPSCPTPHQQEALALLRPSSPSPPGSHPARGSDPKPGSGHTLGSRHLPPSWKPELGSSSQSRDR